MQIPPRPLLTTEEQLLDGAALTQAFGIAVEQAIAHHLQANRPVFYSANGQLCMHQPNGNRLAYQRNADGTREILYRLPSP